MCFLIILFFVQLTQRGIWTGSWLLPSLEEFQTTARWTWMVSQRVISPGWNQSVHFPHVTPSVWGHHLLSGVYNMHITKDIVPRISFWKWRYNMLSRGWDLFNPPLSIPATRKCLARIYKVVFAMQIADTESAAQPKLRSFSTAAAGSSWSRIARVGSLLPISSHVFRPHWDSSEFLLLRWSHHQGRQEDTKWSKPYHCIAWYHLIQNYMWWTNLTGSAKTDQSSWWFPVIATSRKRWTHNMVRLDISIQIDMEVKHKTLLRIQEFQI